MLECKELCAYYGKKQILHNISLAFSRGEFIALIGPNASGKTTLLRTLLSSGTRHSGEVLLDKTPLGTLSRTEIAKRIAYLPQQTKTEDITVFDMVLMGRFPHLSYPRIYRDSDREVAQEVLANMGLSQYRDAPLSTLSGGICQLCYIASALVTGSDYILLDEPTTYLDVKNARELLATLRTLADSGRGILAVLHDIPSALHWADKVALMNKGELVAFGTPDELYSSGAISYAFGATLSRIETENGYVYYFE